MISRCGPEFRGRRRVTKLSSYILAGCAVLTLTLGDCVSIEAGGGGQVNKDAVELEAGKPIERELKGGEAHTYQVSLSANQFLRVAVDQRGIDVALKLFGPDGKQIAEFDSPVGAQGQESISAISDQEGSFRLEVRSTDKGSIAGRYEIKLDVIRPATQQDGVSVAAERGYSEAVRLASQATAESSRKAIQRYEEVLPVFRSTGDRQREADTLIHLGIIHNSLGEPYKALDSYNQALPAARSIANRRIEARALYHIGVAYYYLREIQKAMEYYDQALPVFRSIGDRQWEAVALRSAGQVYDFRGEKEKALEYYDQSLSASRSIGDKRAEAVILNTLGTAYFSLGEMQKALDHHNQGLSIRRTIGDRRGEAASLNNIGQVYDSLGEKQKALSHYNQSLTMIRVVGDKQGETVALTNIGVLYHSLGEPRKALDYFNQVLPMTRSTGDRRTEGATLNNIGRIYDDLGEMQKALDHHNQALTIRRTISDRRGEAASYNNIGQIHDKLGEPQKALDYFNQALPITRSIGDRRGEAGTLSNIGRIHDKLGEPQKAHDFYTESLLVSRAIRELSFEGDNLYKIARVKFKQGDPVQARSNIEGALHIVESLRVKLTSPELRASYFASVQDYYDFYIDLMMRLHDREPKQGHDVLALEASERARARTLLEMLTEARADIRQGVDAALLERERSLQNLLEAKAERQTRLLSGKHTQQQAAEAKLEIDRLLTQFQEVQSQIRAGSPRYAALTQPRPLTLKQIQQEVLDPDTLLLEYALGGERSYLWAITTDSISSFMLPKREEVQKAAQRVYDLLTARNRREQAASAAERQARAKQAEQDYNLAAAELSRMILGPVGGLLGKKRLLVVADGALNYVPFAALPAPGAKARQRLLVADHEIISLPSASSLAVLRNEMAGRKAAPNAVAVLADPVFDADDARVQRSARAEGSSGEIAKDDSDMTLTRSVKEAGLADRGDLPRLPFSRQEADAIQALARKAGVGPEWTKVALGFEASRETASSPDLGRYRIIHFATHGLLNNEHPELSGIVLSLVDNQGKPQNGFFRLYDVYNMNLGAELVVLSACQTALGKQVKGEGLIGLTRGFMYAGSARVMASLWRVEDEATAEMMKRFYEGMIKENQRPAAALRRAQEWMQRQRRWSAPYYWAGFVLQGEWK
ncbi:MAG TPA: tetratricopeptide repeat protein [Blastocatellia bacterium]|nr:tetratricopeptide repeat protein [Blastocatellia bacterium]